MITRRTMLQGMGVSLALPWFESFADPAPPLRAAFFYHPNGVVVPRWNFEETLAPLAPLRDRMLVIRGLAHDKARPNGDGPGDHARAAATFLTGCQAKKTEGREIRVGISVDQVAARKMRTKLPSIELGCEAGALSGNCDSGYSCAYSSSLSWRGPSQPLGKTVKPRQVFDRLFGDPEQPRDEHGKSILDFVRGEAKSLRAELGGTDRAKLDEYLDAVREVEGRLDSGETRAPKLDVPAAIPEHRAYVKLMIDLLVLAFRADVTRIATFMFANEGSDRTYPFLGVREGHHTLSHHGGAKEKLEKIAKIDRFHVEHFAYFAGELSKIREGDATLLDRSMAVFGSSIADGNAHNHENLPVLVAGTGGGTIAPGREVRLPRETPMSNLYLSMLDRLDVRLTKFGDSTGRLEELLSK